MFSRWFVEFWSINLLENLWVSLQMWLPLLLYMESKALITCSRLLIPYFINIWCYNLGKALVSLLDKQWSMSKENKKALLPAITEHYNPLKVWALDLKICSYKTAHRLRISAFLDDLTTLRRILEQLYIDNGLYNV